MFSEDVVLDGLKAGPSWFVSDHLLTHENKSSDPREVAVDIAERNFLSFERLDTAAQRGYKFCTKSLRFSPGDDAPSS
jgi:hypothetical protein